MKTVMGFLSSVIPNSRTVTDRISAASCPPSVLSSSVYLSLPVSPAVTDSSDSADPTAQERALLRYYYYIHNGIETGQVAPMASCPLCPVPPSPVPLPQLVPSL